MNNQSLRGTTKQRSKPKWLQNCIHRKKCKIFKRVSQFLHMTAWNRKKRYPSLKIWQNCIQPTKKKSDIYGKGVWIFKNTNKSICLTNKSFNEKWIFERTKCASNSPHILKTNTAACLLNCWILAYATEEVASYWCCGNIYCDAAR